MSKRVAIVTGANKGIGFHVAKQLAQQRTDVHVLLAARNGERGTAAVSSLVDEGLDNVSLLRLDICNDDDINAAVSLIESKYGGIDILVNNAGMAYKGAAWGEDVARHTIDVNYFGTKKVTDAFFPLLRNDARVVFLGSRAGNLSKFSKAIQDSFLSGTMEQVDQLEEQFITDVSNGSWKDKGWPQSTYGVSKAGINQLARLYQQRELGTSERSGVLFNSMCPGWCATDMAGPRAPRTPAKGAETAVWLALLPKGETNKCGKMWADKREMSY